MSSNTSFSLVDEPWIPVIDHTGARDLISLRRLADTAHQWREIGGETPLARVAILRFLVAILHRALSQRATAEPDLWETLWQDGVLPVEVGDYLSRVHDRLDLYHPEHPFMQAKDLRIKGDGETPEQWKPVTVLRGDRETYIYTMRGEDYLTPADAAQLLIQYFAYSPQGRISQPLQITTDPTKPKGYGNASNSTPLSASVVVVEGDTLAETLLLNYIPMVGEDEDVPSWELDLTHRKIDGRFAGGPAAYLSWPTRRVRLKTDDQGQVRGVLVSSGDPYVEGDVDRFEHMTMWRKGKGKNKAKGYKPYRFTFPWSMWRGLHQMLPPVDAYVSADKDFLPAETVSRVGRLVGTVLPDDYILRYSILSLDLGQSNATILNTDLAHAHIPAVLASEDAADLRYAAVTVTMRAQAGVSAAGKLAKNLAGLRGFATPEAARDEVWQVVGDRVARRVSAWIPELPGTDPEEWIDNSTSALRCEVEQHARTLIDLIPPEVWVSRGRDVNKAIGSFYKNLNDNLPKEKSDV